MILGKFNSKILNYLKDDSKNFVVKQVLVSWTQNKEVPSICVFIVVLPYEQIRPIQFRCQSRDSEASDLYCRYFHSYMGDVITKLGSRVPITFQDRQTLLLRVDETEYHR